MPSSTYLYLGIQGDFEPAEFTKQIGIAPTTVTAQHSRDSERKIPQNSILRFAQTHTDSDGKVVNVYDLADAAYQKLKHDKEQIADALKAYNATATFQVVLVFPISEEVSTPAIGFSSEVINFIAEIGASIDIDTYRA